MTSKKGPSKCRDTAAIAESSNNRTPNFTLAEKDVLLDIVGEFKAVIENKKTDHVSTDQKVAAWREIAEKYNEAVYFGAQRSAKQLENCWKNAKSKQIIYIF